VPQLLQFTNSVIPAQATTTVQYQLNLPSDPKTPNTDPTIPGSELLNPAVYATDPTLTGGSVDGADSAQFVNDSISGGAITAYDATGNAVNIQLRWAKSSTTPDTWNLFYQTNANPALTTDPEWANVGQYQFTNGQLTSGGPSVTVTGMTVDGISLGNVTINHGSSGVTQFADSGGAVQVNALQQNGFAAGSLQSIAVSDKGTITGTYSNGRTIGLAQVTLATFNGPDNLQRLDGGAFAATGDSGAANYTTPAKIVASSLEASNADIGDEFTKLIVTQQAYSANTRVITTSNQMVQDLLNTLR
jgi:flagellar hook protein FlgE